MRGALFAVALVGLTATACEVYVPGAQRNADNAEVELELVDQVRARPRSCALTGASGLFENQADTAAVADIEVNWLGPDGVLLAERTVEGVIADAGESTEWEVTLDVEIEHPRQCAVAFVSVEEAPQP